VQYVARVKIAVAKETREGETRVAMVPELVGKLLALGYEVAVEPGAGAGALHAATTRRAQRMTAS
jgi:NAD(P) transhydrogenase subunit alpha